MSPRLCGVLLIVAGVYLFTIPLWVDPLFADMLNSVGDGMAGIVLAATILLLGPLTLMSTFTPFAVRLLLTSVTVGGRLGSIQSDQKIARMDDIPVLDANFPYDPGFKRLQDLDLARWD